MRGWPVAVLAGVMLAGCVPEVTLVPAPPSEDACGAAALQGLVGQDVAVFEAMSLTGTTRILRPDQAITMDFSAERVNVAVDGSDSISRIFCG